MKKVLVLFLVFIAILTACQNAETTVKKVEENWNIRELRLSDEVLEIFPNELYEFTTIEVNNRNVVDEYLKYRIDWVIPGIDPKVAYENLKIYEVSVVKDRNDEKTLYFKLNQDGGITKADFSKEIIEWEEIDKNDLSSENSIVIIKRK